MLAVVWGSEYFRNYIFGRKFTVVTDHKALVSLLNGNNKKNKTMFSRLTRWIDRIIPFDFVIEHMPGLKLAWRIIYQGIRWGKQQELAFMITLSQWQNCNQSSIHSDKLIPIKGSLKHQRNQLFQLKIYKLETIKLTFHRKRASKRVTVGQPIRSQ